MNAASIPAQRKMTIPWARVVMLIGVVGVLALRAVIFRDRSPFGSGPTDDGTTISGAFLYQQQRSLSCEYASVHLATTMTGQSVSEYEIEALVPLNENPHLGYRGNIHGDWGNTTDYGVYNAPLHSALNQLGIQSDAFYADGDRTTLTGQLDKGHPTIVWLGMWGDTSIDEYSDEGTRYQLTRGMHVMTAYGYDDQGVYLTDPGTAVYQFYDWDQFMTMWDVMDGMGLSVYPPG